MASVILLTTCKGSSNRFSDFADLILDNVQLEIVIEVDTIIAAIKNDVIETNADYIQDGVKPEEVGDEIEIVSDIIKGDEINSAVETEGVSSVKNSEKEVCNSGIDDDCNDEIDGEGAWVCV